MNDGYERRTQMRHLPDAAQGGRETEVTVGPLMALAHNLVSWLESLPGVPGAGGGGLRFPEFRQLRPPFGEVFLFLAYHLICHPEPEPS